MNRLIFIFLLFLTLIFISGCNNSKQNMNFKTPFIPSENPEKNTNAYEPDFYFRPLIYIEITNPTNGKREVVSATIDTGADNCYIGQGLVDHLLLTHTNEPPIVTFTASGSIKSYAVEIEYRIANEKKEIVKDFPIQKTHFYINGSLHNHVALGIRCFIDRFKEVQIHYPNDIEFFW